MTLAELRRLAEATRLGREPPLEVIETASEHLRSDPPVRRAAHEALVAAARADPSEASRAVAALVEAYEWGGGRGAPKSAVRTLRALAVLRPRAFMGSAWPLVRAADDEMGDVDPVVTGLLCTLARRAPSILTRPVAWHVAHADHGVHQEDTGYRLVGIAGATAPTAVRPTVATAVEQLDTVAGQEGDPESLQQALETLQVVGTVLPSMVPRVDRIVALLSHGDTDVRAGAATALSHIGRRPPPGDAPFPESSADRVVSGLVTTSEDNEVEVREAAHEALGRIGAAEPRLAPAAWTPLRRAVRDEERSRSERHLAAVALARLAAVRGPEFREDLLTVLTDALLETPALWGAVERAFDIWRDRLDDWSLGQLPDHTLSRLTRYLLGLPYWEVWDASDREPLVSLCCSFPPEVFASLDTGLLARRHARVLRYRSEERYRTAALTVLSALSRVDDDAATAIVGQVLAVLRSDESEASAEAVAALERVGTDAAGPSERESAATALTTVIARAADDGVQSRASTALQTVVEESPAAATVVVERFCDRQQRPAIGDAPTAFQAAARAAPEAVEPALLDLLAVAAGSPAPGAGLDGDGEAGDGSTATDAGPLAELFGDGESDGGAPLRHRRAAARAVLAGVAAAPETPVIGPAELKPFLWQSGHDDNVVAALAGGLAIRADRFDTRRYAVGRLRTLLARRTSIACPDEPSSDDHGVVGASRALAVVARHAPDAVAPAVRSLAAAGAPAAQRALVRVAIADPTYLPDALARLRTPDTTTDAPVQAGSSTPRHRDPLAALWLLRAYPRLAPALVPTLEARCRAPDAPDRPGDGLEPLGEASYREQVDCGTPEERAFERLVLETVAEAPGAAARRYLEHARYDPDPECRATAYAALDGRPTPAGSGDGGSDTVTDNEGRHVIRALTRALADPEGVTGADRDRLRAVATDTAGVAGTDYGCTEADLGGVLPLLRGTATAVDPGVRRATATAVGLAGHRTPAVAVEILGGLLDDPDPVVVEQAAHAAGRLARTAPMVIGSLEPGLRDALAGPPGAREAALTALGRVRVGDGIGSVDVLVEHLWDPRPGVRRQAAAALARVARHDEAAARGAAPALERRFLHDPHARWTLAAALLAVPADAVESPSRLASGLVQSLAGHDSTDGSAERDDEATTDGDGDTCVLGRPPSPDGPNRAAGVHAVEVLLERLASTDPEAVRVALRALPREVDWEDRLSGSTRRTLPAQAVLAATTPGFEAPGAASLDRFLDEVSASDRWTVLAARALARTGASLHLDHLGAAEDGADVAADVARYLVRADREARAEAAAEVAAAALDTRDVALAIRDTVDSGTHRQGVTAALGALLETHGDAVADVASPVVRRELAAEDWERRLDAVTAVPALVDSGVLDPERAVGFLFRRLDDEVTRVRRAAGAAIGALARETRAGVRCLVGLLTRRLRAGTHHAPHGELRALGVIGHRHRFVRAECRESLQRAADRLDAPLDEAAEAALGVLRGRGDDGDAA